MQLWGQQAPIWGNRPPPAHGWLGQTGTGWGLCCRPEKHAPPTLDTPRTLGILHAGAVGTSTPAVPSDGLCLHVLFLLRVWGGAQCPLYEFCELLGVGVMFSCSPVNLRTLMVGAGLCDGPGRVL